MHHGAVLKFRTNRTYAIYVSPPGNSLSQGYQHLVTQFLTDVGAASGSQDNVYATTLQYSNAGHMPAVLAAPESGTSVLTDARSVPLAVRRDQPRPQASQLLPPGSTLLLFTDGPTRDFQFLRALLSREIDRKKAEARSHIQRQNPFQDNLSPVKALERFPDQAGRAEDNDKSLRSYDVVVAFDPDWLKLSDEQRNALQTSDGHGTSFPMRRSPRSDCAGATVTHLQ